MSRMPKVLSVILCTFVCTSLFGCRDKPLPPELLGPERSGHPEQSPQHIPGELIGLFETRQLAEEAAALYEIELVSYDNEVAVFKCEGDLMELIETGKNKGWPELSPNHVYNTLG